MTINKKVVLEFQSDITEMLENVSAIHGPKTGDFVRMQCNVFALMRLWAEGTRGHPERERLTMMFAMIIQSMASAAADLADMTEQDTRAADKLLDVIGHKYKDMEQRV